MTQRFEMLSFTIVEKLRDNVEWCRNPCINLSGLEAFSGRGERKKGTSRIDFRTVVEPKQYFPFKMCL